MCHVRTLSSLQALLFLFLVGIAQIALAVPPLSLPVKIGVPPDIPPVLRQHANQLVQALNGKSGGRLSAQIVEIDDERTRVARTDAPQISFVDLASDGDQKSAQASIFNAIFSFHDLRAVERFLDSDAGKQSIRAEDGNKRVTLSYWHDGMMQLVAGTGGRRFANSGAPGKDNRIALDWSVPNSTRQFSALGFKVDRGSLRFEKLAVGAVDFAEASWDEILAEAGPRSLLTGSTVIVTNHRYKGYLLVADSAWFAALPPQVRTLLSQEGLSEARRHNGLIAANEEANPRRFAMPSTIRTVPTALEARVRILTTLRNKAAPGADRDELLGHARGTGTRVAIDAPRLPRSPAFWQKWIARSAASSVWGPNNSGTVVVTGARARRYVIATTQKELAVAAWRTWLEDDEGIVYEAEPGREYDLNLTLSRRSARSLVDAGPDMKAAIDTAVREGKKVLPLSIRPVALTGGLQLMATNIQLPFKVQLKRLETRSEDEEEQELDARIDKEDAGLSQHAIAEAFDAAVLSVRVKANPGVACAQVLFSVWDEKGIVPVDMLVATIQISQNGSREKCEVPELQGGFSSFLGDTESLTQADAGLSLFEYLYAGEVRTVAMFVSGTDYRRGVANLPILQRGVHVWFLDRPLSGFIDGDLSGAVFAARRDGHYEVPADHLAKSLFPPADAQAQKALKTLQQIVVDKKTSAWIHVRGARANGKYFYPPLALLAAQGGVLQKRPMFVYPLPTSRRQGESCIGVWKAVIPEKLDGEVVEVDGIDLPGRMEAIREFNGFRTFLSTAPVQGNSAMVAQRPTTEGLLLLAHHDNGNLWFSDNGTREKVLPTENNRVFAKGSAAILNACHTASGIGYNQDLIEKFNRNGMDAMLVTPFAMDKDYGEQFARAMVKAIHRVYAEGKGVTLAALMDQVAQETMNDPAAGKDAQRMLEMVFVGNPAIRLCDRP